VFTATKITNMSGSIAGGETSVKGTFDGVITRKSVKLNVSDDLKKILETYVPKAMMDRLKVCRDLCFCYVQADLCSLGHTAMVGWWQLWSSFLHGVMCYTRGGRAVR